MDVKQHNLNLDFLAEKLAGKKIMVSGATGLVGAAIVRYIMQLNDKRDANICIFPLFRNKDKFNQLFDAAECREDFCPLIFDTDNNIDFKQEVDYIIHCAGISGGSKMHLKDPVRIFDIGVNGTRKLLDYAALNKCQGFLYVSTYEVYGNVSMDEPIDETHPSLLNPMVLRDSYAEVKRLCESMCVAFSAKYGFNVYSGRLTSTFGTGVKYDDPRFFAEFARCTTAGKDIVLKSKGGTVRNYLDVDDAASAFLYILANGENLNAYNLTNRNNQISIKDIALKIIKLDGERVKLVFDIDESNSMGFRKEGKTVMNPDKLEAIGWKPVFSLDETLTKLLEAIRSKIK